MTADFPRLTVITVTYNASATLARAIESVASQDYPNLEYLIIDGASSDDTIAIAEQHRDIITHMVSEPDSGSPDAANKGAALATGEWVGFLHADDTYAPGALLEIGKAIAADASGASTLFTGFTYRNEDGKIKGLYANPDFMALSVANITRSILFSFTAFYRKDIFKQYGPFITDKSDCYYANDQEFLLRLVLGGETSIGVGRPLMDVYAGAATQSGSESSIIKIFEERVELVDTLLAKDGVSDADATVLKRWQMQEATKRTLWDIKRLRLPAAMQGAIALAKQYGPAPFLFAPAFLFGLAKLKLGLMMSGAIRTDL